MISARYLLSTSAARRRKMRSADTCASNRVAICRERITTSLLDTFLKKPISILRADFFVTGSMDETMRPRRCRVETATSTESASTVPARSCPSLSSAWYEKSIGIYRYRSKVFGSFARSYACSIVTSPRRTSSANERSMSIMPSWLDV